MFVVIVVVVVVCGISQGHVDFSYEVSRSLKACQGVLLLVDAQQVSTRTTMLYTWYRTSDRAFFFLPCKWLCNVVF